MKLHDLDERELSALEEQDDLIEDLEISGNEQRGQGRDGSAREPGRGRKKKGILAAVLVVLFCIVLILAVVYIALRTAMGEEDAKPADATVSAPEGRVYTPEEVEEMIGKAVQDAREEEAGRILSALRENFTSGVSDAMALRPFYPDQVVVGPNGAVRFYPINENLKKNSYSDKNLTRLENGELQYLEDGQIISHKGIDVAKHQGVIDWSLVAQDGVEFAFLRVGNRGYGTGKMVLDEQFENNVKGALTNNIKVGVYFYSQSVNREEALEEANFVLEQIAPYKITGPVVYDTEIVRDSRTSGLTATERTDMAVCFCETVKEAGYRPMIYMNLNSAFTILELERLEEYDKWFAHYGTDMYYPYDYKIWQYSDHGTVSGIETEVDLNMSFEEWD